MYDILYPRHNNIVLSIFLNPICIRTSDTEMHYVYISEKNVYRRFGDEIAVTEIMSYFIIDTRFLSR